MRRMARIALEKFRGLLALLRRASGRPLHYIGRGYRHELGGTGERLAEEALERAGYRIVDRNYRCRAGELDIVAVEGDAVVFVEVRVKTVRSRGKAAGSLGDEKRRRVARAAMWYIRDRKLPSEAKYRFDVVAIDGGPEGSASVQIHRSAFRLDEIFPGRYF
jgi:putative endonuclease